MEYAIWWLTQAAIEEIDPDETYYSSPNETLSGLPEYILSQFSSRIGRAGRGRLWVPNDIPVEEITWNTSKVITRVAAKAGGIGIHAKDVKYVLTLPGFVTDLDMNLWVLK